MGKHKEIANFSHKLQDIETINFIMMPSMKRFNSRLKLKNEVLKENIDTNNNEKIKNDEKKEYIIIIVPDI